MSIIGNILVAENCPVLATFVLFPQSFARLVFPLSSTKNATETKISNTTLSRWAMFKIYRPLRLGSFSNAVDSENFVQICPPHFWSHLACTQTNK